MNGFLIARAGFLSVTAAVPWLAAWLWRAEKLQDAGCKWQDVFWLALAIGVGILAGHAQTAVYGLVFVSLYFMWRVFSDRASLHLSIPRSLILFGLAVLLGLALAAAQPLPAAELTRESQRADGLDYTRIMMHSFWPLRLLTLLSPDFFGSPAQNSFWGYDNYWENAAYIGLIPLLLALYAIWIASGAGSRKARSVFWRRRRSCRWRWPLAGSHRSIHSCITSCPASISSRVRRAGWW